MLQRFVANVFKIILGTLLIILVSNLSIYLIQTYNVTQRGEMILNSMQNEVSRNNYLTADAYNTYASMLDDLKEQYNGYVDVGDGEDPISFIDYWTINYDGSAVTDHNNVADPMPNLVGTGGMQISNNLAEPTAYGDIAVIEITMYVQRFTLFKAYEVIFYGDNKLNSTKDELEANGFNRVTKKEDLVPIKLTCQVPCLKYVAEVSP